MNRRLSLLLLLLAPAAPAAAQCYSGAVTSAAALSAAITADNAAGTNCTITLQGSINLFNIGSTLPTITGNVTIVGNGNTITGENLYPLLTVGSGSGANTVFIENVTLAAGAGSQGAGVYVNSGSSAALVGVTFTDNQATGLGGAVYVSTGAGITITNGGMDGTNVAPGGSSGAYLGGGTLLAYDVTGVATSTVAANISGSSDLGIYKFGTGTLLLSGSNSYQGRTEINQGVLQLGSAGALPVDNTVLIDAAGTLDLNGYAPSLGAVTNNGLVKVGIETLHATSYTGAGTLQTTIASASSYGQLNTSGAVNLLTGAVLDVVFANGFRPNNSSQIYQIITAGGGLTGTFSAIDLSSPILRASATYTADGLDLSFFLGASFASQAATPNQAAVGAALDQANLQGNADLQPLIANLSGASVAQLQEAYTELSPIAYGALPRAQLMITRGVFPDIDRHLAALRDSDVASTSFYNDDALAAARPGAAPGAGLLAQNGGLGDATSPGGQPLFDSPWGTFAAFHRANVTLDEFNAPSGLQPGLAAGITELTAGAQYRDAENLIFGFSGSYAQTSANVGDGLGSASVDTLLLGSFGTLYDGGLHLDWYGGLGISYYTMQRTMPTFGQTADADPQGKQVDLRVSGGWDQPLGRVIVSPIGSLEYHYLGIGSFAETGAGAYDLRVGGQSGNSLSASLGGKVAGTVRVFGIDVMPSAAGSWRHEFVNQNETISANLDGGAGPAFSVQAVGPGADALELSGRLDARVTRAITAFIEYAGEYGRLHESADQWGFGAKYQF